MALCCCNPGAVHGARAKVRRGSRRPGACRGAGRSQHGGRCMATAGCETAADDGAKEAVPEKKARGSLSGVSRSCAFLLAMISNMSIVRRWGVEIGYYCRLFFFFFFKKNKDGKEG